MNDRLDLGRRKWGEGLLGARRVCGSNTPYPEAQCRVLWGLRVSHRPAPGSIKQARTHSQGTEIIHQVSLGVYTLAGKHGQK